MIILVLVSAKPLEINVDMVLVEFNGLSPNVICLCQWTNETEKVHPHGLAAI